MIIFTTADTEIRREFLVVTVLFKSAPCALPEEVASSSVAASLFCGTYLPYCVGNKVFHLPWMDVIKMATVCTLLLFKFLCSEIAYLAYIHS